MPVPITAPTPSAVRLHGPSVRRRRRPGACDSSTNRSMLFVRSSCDTALPFALSGYLSSDLALVGSARIRALGFGRRLLASLALQTLPFGFVFDLFCIQGRIYSCCNVAYFSMSFFKPYPGKLTVILASSPSPSRRRIVPVPYLG